MSGSDPNPLIDLIHDAAVDDAAFAHLPEHLAQWSGGRSATLQLMDPALRHLDFAGSYFSDAMYADYLDGFYVEDVWMQAGRTIADNHILALDEMVSYGAFCMTTLYNDFLRANGDDTAHCLGGRLSGAGGVMFVGIHRAHATGAFDATEAARLQALVPALNRLHDTRRRFRTTEDRAWLAAGAIDRFNGALMIVRGDGTVMMANRAAEALLTAKDGLSVRDRRLEAFDAASNQSLADALQAATASQNRQGAALPVARDGRPPLRAIVTVMAGGHTAMVALEAPLPPTVIARAAAMYRLTAAEAALLDSLAAGETLEQHAEHKGVRLTTVRSQLASIFDKTETRSQSQVLLLLGRLPPLRLD